MADLEKIYPAKEIYNSRHGQNWQILIPILSVSTPVISKKTFYNVLIRQQSMSRSIVPLKIIERENGYWDILSSISVYINKRNEKTLQNIINCKSINVMNFSFKYGNKRFFYKHFWRYSRKRNSLFINIKLFFKAFIIIFKKDLTKK